MLACVVAKDDRLQPRLDFLQPERANDGLTDSDMTTLRAFGFKRRGG